MIVFNTFQLVADTSEKFSDEKEENQTRDEPCNDHGQPLRKKPNKVARDPVAHERLSSVTKNLALNPVFSVCTISL
jgi:hypothetical protein